ncbi:MAG: FGGY family carbohydrate kinase [Spirulinaceae cyanobacterium]
MDNYLIGIDIGTTSVKSVLFTSQGKIVSKYALDYPLYSPVSSAAEQDPEEIFTATINIVRQVVAQSKVNPKKIIALSFSSAMHSLIAVDGEGKPLTQSITWADNRSAEVVETIRQWHSEESLYQRTGLPLHPMSPLVKIFWLKQKYPEIFKQATKFISIKEYVLFKLFHQYVVDYSMAAATGLFNLKEFAWDEEILAFLGISKKQLSQVVPTTHILDLMEPKYSSYMGLSTQISTIVGSSDGVLSNLGLGALKPGVTVVTVGTSGAVRTSINKVSLSFPSRLFCYPLTAKHWVIGGASNSGGNTLQWLKKQLLETEENYETLTALAQKIAPGAEGLIFHPYLTGERAPLWNPNAKGSFFGLSLRHGKAHLVRAVLEGVVYNLYSIFQSLAPLNSETKVIKATGGFANSELWRQILADVFEQEVIVPTQLESSCLGAIILALYALQHIPSLDSFTPLIQESYTHQVIRENSQIYRKVMPVYQHLGTKFREEYSYLQQALSSQETINGK